jgi:hypothetical protein
MPAVLGPVGEIYDAKVELPLRAADGCLPGYADTPIYRLVCDTVYLLTESALL